MLRDAGTIRPEQGVWASSTTCENRSRSHESAAPFSAPRAHSRVFRDAAREHLESVLTYEGTSEIHQLVVGQALTGQAAFR
jgi:glutaryl-CoA dehydrogenase